VIISKEVNEGQTVAASFQTPNMFKIAGDLTKMKIDVNLAEADISKVKAGMPVTFTVDTYPDKEFTGSVETVNLNPSNQSGVVTYTMAVTLENKEKLLLPGMTAYVNVVLSEIKDVLRIPAAALRFSPPQEQVSGFKRLLSGNTRGRMMPRMNTDRLEATTGTENIETIYLLKDEKPSPVSVKIGATDDNYVEISGEGVAEGDTVITGVKAVRKQ
jgi:HlyD family secretion protein